MVLTNDKAMDMLHEKISYGFYLNAFTEVKGKLVEEVINSISFIDSLVSFFSEI